MRHEDAMSVYIFLMQNSWTYEYMIMCAAAVLKPLRKNWIFFIPVHYNFRGTSKYILLVFSITDGLLKQRHMSQNTVDPTTQNFHVHSTVSAYISTRKHNWWLYLVHELNVIGFAARATEVLLCELTSRTLRYTRYQESFRKTADYILRKVSALLHSCVSQFSAQIQQVLWANQTAVVCFEV